MSKVEKETLTVGDHTVSVLVHYEMRKNARVAIGKKGISIRLPRHLSKGQKEKHLEDFRTWAKNKLVQRPELLHKPKIKQYESGQVLTIQGDRYILDIVYKDTKTSKAMLKKDMLYLFLSRHMKEATRQKVISQLISRCMADKYYDWMFGRLQLMNRRYFNKSINQFRLKYTNSVWGSCSRKGNINISTRLLLAPVPVIDYVLIHELAHLLQPNHSRKFWELVRLAMPDYKEKIKWLKKNGHICDF